MKNFNVVIFTQILIVLSSIKVVGQINNIQQDSLLLRVYYKFIHKYDKNDTTQQFVTDNVLMVGKTKTRFSNAKFDETSPLPDIVLHPPKLSPEQLKRLEVERSKSQRLITLTIPNRLLLNETLYRILNNNIFITIGTLGYKDFKVEMAIPEINWTLKSDTKNINGIECQMATGRFEGRNYTAWFALSVPYPYGPWKLGGLPGLILEAYDENKEVKFLMTRLLNDAKKDRFLYYEELRPTLLNAATYEKIKERYYKDPIAIYKSQLEPGEMVQTIQYENIGGEILKNGQAIEAINREARLKITNPLELNNK